MTTIQEYQEFWDDFAQEYEEIQQESTFPIAEDLCAFLLEKQLLPCQTFLDLAGGTGRYLSPFQTHVEQYTLVDFSQEMLKSAAKKAGKNVQLIHAEQTAFFQQAPRYDLVFSAMNPALRTKEELLSLIEHAKKHCLLFRVIEDQDTLFSPYEEASPDFQLNTTYKHYLTEAGISFQTKQFHYQKEENVSKSFFHDYFVEEWTEKQLDQAITKHFGDQEFCLNQQSLVFELIYFPPRNVYTRKETTLFN